MDYLFDDAFLLLPRTFGGWIDDVYSFEILNEKQLEEIDAKVRMLAEHFSIARFYDENGKSRGGVVLNQAQEIELRTRPEKNSLIVPSFYTENERELIRDIMGIQ